MDFLYYTHHGDEIPDLPPDQERGGFRYPFKLVLLGYKEKAATGRYPDPLELAKRIKPQFVADIDYLGSLIEKARPKPPPGTNQ